MVSSPLWAVAWVSLKLRGKLNDRLIAARYAARLNVRCANERRRNRCRQEGAREHKNPERPGEAEPLGV